MIGKVGYRKQKGMPLKGKIYLFIAVNLEKDLKFPHIVLYPIWREELRCGVDLLEKMSV